jgi:hypothetical protein
LGAARDPGIGTAAPTATQPMARARPPIDCESESYGRYYQDAHGQLRTLPHSAARCGPLASADNGSMLAALERRIISVLVAVLVIP